MSKLSAVIITLNEENNIGRCIKSVLNVADETIVLDSFSSDSTVAIAKDMGAIVHQQTFLGYGAQRNAAAALAANDYILFLDADEFLSEVLVADILEQKQRCFPSDAYTMNRLNRYCGQWIKHGSWYPDSKLRLYNRLKGKWTDAIVHEEVKLVPTSKITHLPGNLLHYAYESVAQHIMKNKKYGLLSSQALFQKGKKVSIIKLFINPLWAFLCSYLIRLGFLDKKNGLIIAILIAHLTYLKYYQVLKLRKNIIKVKQERGKVINIGVSKQW